MVEEPFDYGELVGVDWLIRVRYVMGVPHRMRQSIHTQQQWWSVRECEFPI